MSLRLEFTVGFFYVTLGIFSLLYRTVEDATALQNTLYVLFLSFVCTQGVVFDDSILFVKAIDLFLDLIELTPELLESLE